MIGKNFRAGSESEGCAVASGAALSFCNARMTSGAFGVDSTNLAATPLIGSGSLLESKLPQIGTCWLAFSVGRMSHATNSRFGATDRSCAGRLLR
jgi:hypothetical protein